jgi:hypothetical protein
METQHRKKYCSFVYDILCTCTSIQRSEVDVSLDSIVLVCGCFVAGIAGSNPALGMDVCLWFLYIVLSCVGRGLCDVLITRPEES